MWHKKESAMVLKVYKFKDLIKCVQKRFATATKANRSPISQHFDGRKIFIWPPNVTKRGNINNNHQVGEVIQRVLC